MEKYKIVTGKTREEVVTKVNELMNEIGCCWQPIGGCQTMTPYGDYCYQTMFNMDIL
jgi:hypothetical protein